MDTQIDLLSKNKGNSKQSKPRQLNGFSSMMSTNSTSVDFCEIKGQYLAKRSLEIAAAGSHHTMLIGPTGSGKTMFIKALQYVSEEVRIRKSSPRQFGKIRIAAHIFVGLAFWHNNRYNPQQL
jgi:ABC-type transport system involved in cytochrome bd biosynthesis fused ATPase/permease subunit